MGERSEFFEPFLEDHSANNVNKQANLQLVQKTRNQERSLKAASIETGPVSRELIMQAWLETKSKSFLVTNNCPKCGLLKLNTYRLHDTFYLCECQDCGCRGRGETHAMALKNTFDAIGDGLDWRDNTI